MSELTTSASEPSYITKLALSSAPFNDLIEPALFYAGGQAGHRLNLLLHLVRASDKIANLVAEQGYGKSALLMQFNSVRVMRFACVSLMLSYIRICQLSWANVLLAWGLIVMILSLQKILCRFSKSDLSS